MTENICVRNVILLHAIALCNFDLGIMMSSGATAVYIQGPLLEGNFYVVFYYMFRHNWPSSGVAG
jgi:hypothetical protein